MLKGIALSASLFMASFSAFAGETVDINSADAETIAEKLEGIGLAKARAIVKYREENGPFESVDQLADVQGIGEKTVEKIRSYVELGKDVY